MDVVGVGSGWKVVELMVGSLQQQGVFDAQPAASALTADAPGVLLGPPRSDSGQLAHPVWKCWQRRQRSPPRSAFSFPQISLSYVFWILEHSLQRLLFSQSLSGIKRKKSFLCSTRSGGAKRRRLGPCGCADTSLKNVLVGPTLTRWVKLSGLVTEPWMSIFGSF